MALGADRLRSIIESILMLAPEPVPVARLVEVIQIEDAQTEAEDVRAAIAELVAQYRDPDRQIARGMRVDEVAGGLQYRTTPENAQFARRFLAAKPQRLSKASLETLSIIAYRQPCTKPEVESVRGVDATAAMRNLLERDLVKILGKREEVGRPIIYGTTPYFLEFFGLKTLNELPSLREYHELDIENQAQVDELDEARGPSIRDLAAAASTLVEPDEADPDLDALEAAVKVAEKAKQSSDVALEPGGSPSGDGTSKPES
ncbi:MAG: SMC-Scp complex subunit ScpB [Myxococcota bacterium]